MLNIKWVMCVQATSTKFRRESILGIILEFSSKQAEQFLCVLQKTEPFTPYLATMEPECETRKLSGLMKYTLYSLLK